MRLLLLLALGTACLAQDAEVGKGIFRIYCAPCHGIGARGGRGPDLSRGVFRSGDTDDDLFRTISHGVPGTEMGDYGRIGDDNIRRVIAYIRSVNRNDNTPVTGDPSRGEAVFWGKGQCGNCHMVSGKGKAIGPDLSRVGRQRSVAYLRESLVDPNADVSPGYNMLVVVRRDGSKVTGIEKSLDNFSARLMDLSGQIHTFSKDEVKSIQREYKSVMPPHKENVDDLVAYLARAY